MGDLFKQLRELKWCLLKMQTTVVVDPAGGQVAPPLASKFRLNKLWHPHFPEFFFSKLEPSIDRGSSLVNQSLYLILKPARNF